MPLTPEDVQKKLFTTVKFREGYEQAEVDEFLDQVEAELGRLLHEIDELKAQAGPAANVAATGESPAGTGATDAPAVRASAAPQIVVRNAADVGEGAARLLAMAQRTADETVAEAQSDAERMVIEARENAERLTTEASAKADELDRETRARSTALDAELAEQRTRMLGKLEEERSRLEREVEDLKSFEREYRGRMRAFLEGQLDQLQNRGVDDTPLAPPAGAAIDDASGAEEVPAAAASAPPTPQSALGRILAEEEEEDSSS